VTYVWLPQQPPQLHMPLHQPLLPLHQPVLPLAQLLLAPPVEMKDMSRVKGCSSPGSDCCLTTCSMKAVYW
jgi:hypothetical protein